MRCRQGNGDWGQSEAKLGGDDEQGAELQPEKREMCPA
jgi:hypothetical protein